MKILKLKPILMILFLVLVQSGNLTAMGVREDTKAYKSELQQEFNKLIDSIYRSETDAVSAKNSLKVLRTKYDISYTDEAGILDSIIDRADEQTLTFIETHFYFGLLQEGKLMKYRQEAYREESEQYKRELVSLLQQQLESFSAEIKGKNQLLANLNNYYDFVGLEYDEEYFRLKNLILSLSEGSITDEDMAAGLESIDRELIHNSNLRMAQSINEQLHEKTNGQQSEGYSQQGTADKASEPSSKPSSPGAGSQKPPESGSGSHK